MLSPQTLSEAGGRGTHGAHALGAAAYAVQAAALAAPARREAAGEEIDWQLRHISPPVRAALRQLPHVGQNASGPLGPGLLASGLVGSIIRELQAGLMDCVSHDDHGWCLQPSRSSAASLASARLEPRGSDQRQGPFGPPPHAFAAACTVGELGLTPANSTRLLPCELLRVLGSGKLVTPCLRMHFEKRRPRAYC